MGKAAAVVASAVVLTSCGSLDVLRADRDFDQRVYAGAGIVLSQLEPDTSGVAGVSIQESNSSGAGLLLGYDLNNRFSVEGHAADLGSSDLSPSGAIDYQVAGLSALVYGFGNEQDRVRREGFSIFGRLGLGLLDNAARGVRYRRVNDVHLLAGAGLEYGFYNGLAARAELLAHETDAKYAQLGLLYRFGTGSRRSTSTAAALPGQAIEPVVPLESAVDTAPVPLPDPVLSDPAMNPPETPQAELADPSGSELLNLSPLEPDSVPAAIPEPQVVDLSVPDFMDSDEDGISDDIDDCPDTASGLPVDATGCEAFGGAMEGINFRTGSADLTEGAMTVLSDVAQTLQAYPDIRVLIKAYTDNMGDAADNLQLSKRRALAVARFLVDQGISGSRLKPQAFGESNPRDTNETPAGRAANRRVELDVLR